MYFWYTEMPPTFRQVFFKVLTYIASSLAQLLFIYFFQRLIHYDKIIYFVFYVTVTVPVMVIFFYFSFGDGTQMLIEYLIW